MADTRQSDTPQIVFDFIPNDAPLTAGFTKVETKAKDHANKVNNTFKTVGNSINIANYFDTQAKKVEKEAEQHVGKLNNIFKSVGSGLSGIFSGALSVFGGNLLTSGFEKALDLGKELYHLGIDFQENWEQAALRIAGVTGSAKEAQKALEGLYSIAIDRGLAFEPFEDAAVKLASANYSAEEMTHTMQGLAAATEALGKGSEGFGTFVSMISRMEDSGKAAGRGLMSLEMQGFHVFSTLEKMTGISRKVMSKKFLAGDVDPRGSIAVLTEGWKKEYGDFYDTLGEEQQRTMNLLAPIAAKAVAPAIDETIKGMHLIQAAIEKAGPGMGEGLNKAMMIVIETMNSTLEKLLNVVGVKLEIHSPSKVFERFGIACMQGLADGFVAGADRTQAALERTFQKILDDKALQSIIQAAAKTYNVPAELISAVIAKESSGNPNAVSPAGAKGLMQLMPATAGRHGVTNIFDPTQNVMGGTAELAQLLSRFGGDTNTALSRYNWSGRGQMPAETVDYVSRISRLLSGNNTATGQTPNRYSGIYAGVPNEDTMKGLIASPDQQRQLDEYNRIIQETTDQLNILNQAIDRAQTRIAHMGDGQEKDRLGMLITSKGGFNDQRDKLKEIAANTAAERDSLVDSINATQSNNDYTRQYFRQLLQAVQVVSPKQWVTDILAQKDSNLLSTTFTPAGFANNKDIASQILGEDFITRMRMHSDAVDAMTKGEINLTKEEQNRHREIVFGNQNIFQKARPELREIRDTAELGVKDAEVQAIVDIPKGIGQTIEGFITKMDFSAASAKAALLEGFRSVVVAPIAHIFEQQIEKWIAQMLINLIGEKIMGTTQVTATAVNSAAVVANTIAVTANTAAIVATSAANTATSFLDILSKGASAAGTAGKAVGGPINSGQFYKVHKDEWIVPLGAGNVIPVQDVDRYRQKPTSQRQGNTIINVNLNAPVLGGSGHEVPRSRREYLEMLSGGLKEAFGG